MRPSERLKMVESVAVTLQSRWTFLEIDHYFEACQVDHSAYSHSNYGSKRVYSQAVLASVPDKRVLEIAADLGIVQDGVAIGPIEPPVNWRDTKRFRLFISHISSDKLIATRLKEALAPFHIAGFVAHEDIHPTLAWQDEIERGLRTMDAMVAVHTKGFSQSHWTQQEIGFALGRGIKIISFKFGEDPTGFIGKHQALSRLRRSAEEIAKEIEGLLGIDPRTAERLKEAQPNKSFAGFSVDDELDEDVPF